MDTAFYGEPISTYTREQAIEDGTLVDVTEWGSADKGFIGGFKCPVAFTRTVWNLTEVPKGNTHESQRGRAHDVLWMASLHLRSALRHDDTFAVFKVIIGRITHKMYVKLDGDGVTVMLPEDY